MLSEDDFESSLDTVCEAAAGSIEGVFGPASLTWRVDREAAVFFGAGRALLLQLAHPWECLDHVVVSGERHLRHILLSYMSYHNEIRTHLSLEKDAPILRAVEVAGRILCRPILGGLHHQYVRI